MYRSYSYHCTECDADEDRVLTPAEHGEAQACARCGKPLAAIFSGVPAIIGTDKQYYRRRGPLLEQFKNRHDLNVRLARAKRDGFRPGINDVYEPGLASYPGDPKAFISGGRSQIKRRIEEMRAAPTAAPVPLAESVVRQKAREMCEKEPSLAHLPKGELRERVIDKYGAKK